MIAKHSGQSETCDGVSPIKGDVYHCGMSKTPSRQPATPSPAPPASNKWGDLGIRVISSLALIAIELTIIASGYYGIAAQLLILMTACIYEFVRVGIDPSKENLIPSYIKLMPYFFSYLVQFAIAGPLVLKNLFPEQYFAKYHSITCYAIAAILIMLYVINLTPENDHYAFTRLAWSLLASFIIGIPASLYAYIANYSLFWFFCAIALVLFNDTGAYFSGRLFGRHQLIALSPKKTVEGFVGAAFITVAVGFGLPLAFSYWPFSYCPNVRPFSFSTQCIPPAEFIKTTIHIAGKELNCYPAQIHCIVLALFASLISPFGGFLASGLKRAFNKKDFGNIIPGHGGILDRVDCILFMGPFAYLYLKTFAGK